MFLQNVDRRVIGQEAGVKGYIGLLWLRPRRGLRALGPQDHLRLLAMCRFHRLIRIHATVGLVAPKELVLGGARRPGPSVDQSGLGRRVRPTMGVAGNQTACSWPSRRITANIANRWCWAIRRNITPCALHTCSATLSSQLRPQDHLARVVRQCHQVLLAVGRAALCPRLRLAGGSGAPDAAAAAAPARRAGPAAAAAAAAAASAAAAAAATRITAHPGAVRPGGRALCGAVTAGAPGLDPGPPHPLRGRRHVGQHSFRAAGRGSGGRSGGRAARRRPDSGPAGGREGGRTAGLRRSVEAALFISPPLWNECGNSSKRGGASEVRPYPQQPQQPTQLHYLQPAPQFSGFGSRPWSASGSSVGGQSGPSNSGSDATSSTQLDQHRLPADQRSVLTVSSTTAAHSSGTGSTERQHPGSSEAPSGPARGRAHRGGGNSGGSPWGGQLGGDSCCNRGVACAGPCNASSVLRPALTR